MADEMPLRITIGDKYGPAMEITDQAEAALLVRFGMNATTELRSRGTSVHRDNAIDAQIVIGKRVNSISSVPKAR